MMIRFHEPIQDIPAYQCKDSKPCDRIDSQLVDLFTKKLSPPVDSSKQIILVGDENILKRKQYEEYSPDLQSCFDSDFLSDLARIKDTEVNGNEMSYTASYLHDNTSDVHVPSRKKQKRRDSMTIFQSMVDDGDLDFDNDEEHDFDNDEEQTTSSNSELSLPKAIVPPGESPKINKDPAKYARKNRSNQVKRRRSRVGNDSQSHWGKVESVYISERLIVPPSIICDRTCAIESLNTLQDCLQKSKQSHHLLTQWDIMMGLKKCDARTMVKSAKSRKKLFKLVTKTIKKLS